MNLSGDRRINSGIFVGHLHHMAVCHNIFDRFPGVADCKPRPHTTSSVSLGILDHNAYHYNPVARLIGVRTAPAYQAQYAEHAGDQANNQQQDGNNLLAR